MVSPSTMGFEISISARDDGTIEAMYVHLSKKKVARTSEIVGNDEVLADYDSEGNLVGIEILSPVKLKKIVEMVDEPRRAPFRKFIRTAAPSELVTT